MPLPIGKGIFGAGDVTRTRDLLITNQLHYRLCYTSKYDIIPCSNAALQTAKSRCAVAVCTPAAAGVPTVLHQQNYNSEQINDNIKAFHRQYKFPYGGDFLRLSRKEILFVISQDFL